MYLQHMDNIQLNEQQNLILYYLYKFRFLTVFHFLKLLNHKNHHRIDVWLKDLIKHDLISRNYSRKFASTAAAYFLTPRGIKYLKIKRKDIFKRSFKRLNREREKTKPFISHCLFIATLYIKFLELAAGDTVQFLTEIEMIKDREFLPEKLPDAYVSIQHERQVVKRYFVKVFNDWLSDEARKKIINTYIDYSGEGDWEANTGYSLPTFLFIAPTEKIKNQIYYYAKNILEDEISDIQIFVSTRDYIKAGGVKKEVWRKIEEKPAVY